LPPDVNKSAIRWTGLDRRVRVGLLSIKGLSDKTQTRIVSRRRPARYSSVQDFLDRVRPDESETRALIHCGALDAVHPGGNRAALMWELALWQKARSNRSAGRGLFHNPENVPSLPPENERERLRREFAVLGFLCDRHPMEMYRKTLEKIGTVKAAHLPRFVGKRVRLAAWLITGKVVHTKHGDPMEFLTFEDESGIVETTFFPKVYRRFCHMIDRGRPFILTGKVEQDWGAVTLTVDHVEKLSR